MLRNSESAARGMEFVAAAAAVASRVLVSEEADEGAELFGASENPEREG